MVEEVEITRALLPSLDQRGQGQGATAAENWEGWTGRPGVLQSMGSQRQTSLETGAGAQPTADLQPGSRSSVSSLLLPPVSSDASHGLG